MRFSCEKALLTGALAVAGRTVAMKSAITALEGIYISADQELTLTGYNLETGITVKIPAQIQQTGNCVFPARLFAEIVRKLPDDIVNISVDETLHVSIQCGISSFQIAAESGEDYPELPEVDGLLGTGSYGDICAAIDEVMGASGLRPCHLGNIHTAPQDGGRILSTPPWYAYLRIAEGCDNHCAYCVIPSLRGKYRSRPMEGLLEEARELADAGVKELLVIAQDITRYGTDLNGEHQLASLLRELCRLDFHWVRLHYLYPDEITEELIDTIAEEPKIVKYLDIPIQHCNDGILKAMNRRDTKAELLDLLTKLRARIPGLVLRTSLITGLPGEGEAELEELCVFLRETKIERAGVFPFSPEEGTRAARMDHVDMEEARRRAELVVDVQSDIIDDYNDALLGQEREVLCEGFDGQAQMLYGRSYAESPDIDGRIWFTADEEVPAGTFVTVRLTGTMDGELTGELVE